MTPNDLDMGRTAPLTSKRCILYIYSTNIGTEYYKHARYSPFLLSSKCSLFHNANLFGSCIIHTLYTGCAKIKKNNSDAKRLSLLQRRRALSGLFVTHILGHAIGSTSRVTTPHEEIMVIIINTQCVFCDVEKNFKSSYSEFCNILVISGN